MSDFLGRPLKHNDLVVSKPGGRYAKMKLAIVRDEIAGVWFGKGSWGGSDIIWIDTANYPDLEEKRLAMVAEREKELSDRAIAKIDKAKYRIKKKDFKRFGVYSSSDGWDAEIFLGTCLIGGETVENTWMPVTRKSYKDTHSKEITKIEFWRGGGYYSRGSFNPQSHRSVKYPQKFIEDFVLTEDEFHDKYKESEERLMAHSDYSYGSLSTLIKIL